MNKKTIASWCLYDFANSIYVAVIPATIWQVYYINAIVGNSDGQGDWWWGRALSVSMALVALSSPMMGAVADYAGVRKKLLIVWLVEIGSPGSPVAMVIPPEISSLNLALAFRRRRKRSRWRLGGAGLVSAPPPKKGS